MNQPNNTPEQNEPKLRATYENIPDHSDLRGFSYRGPDSEEHPERNDKFEMKAPEGLFPGKTPAEKGLVKERALGADAPQTGKGFEVAADSLSGQGNEAEIDENDNEDILEEVRGGLRADVPDENEYDDADAHARQVAKRKIG